MGGLEIFCEAPEDEGGVALEIEGGEFLKGRVELRAGLPIEERNGANANAFRDGDRRRSQGARRRRGAPIEGVANRGARREAAEDE
jgi:hypothetical protein